MEGKALIVYYSWTGNTAALAEEIQAQTGFDVARIEEVKPSPFGSLPMAAMGAWLHLKSKTKPLSVNLDDYDTILLGFQVWAGNTTPAINRFLNQISLKNKKVYLLITNADQVPSVKVVSSVQRRIEQRGGIVIDTLGLTAKMLATMGDEDRKASVLSREAIRDTVTAWLVKNNFISNS